MFTGFARTVILYLFLILGVRLMGKRQVGELEPSELVLSLLIADLAAVPMQDYGIPLLSGLTPILTLLAMTMALSVLTLKSLPLRTLLCGKPSVLIRAGVLDPVEMRRSRITVDELLEELRLQGYTDPSQIGWAVLETNGQLSLLPRPSHRPLTPEQLGLAVEEESLPRVVISDGKVMPRELAALGRDRAWLAGELKGTDPAEVFLLLADESGVVYRAAREGRA